MLYRCSLLAAAIVLSPSACVAPEPPAPDDDAVCAEPAEHVAETADDLTRSGICTGICQAVSSVGCGPAVSACAEGVAVSAGAALVPCALAVPLACLGGFAGCTDLCLRLFPLTVDEAASG